MQAAITTKKLSKVFGTRKAVDNISIEVPQGAFLSIFGPNGAGKTTLLRMLSTLSRPTSGSATLMGIDLKEDADKAWSCAKSTRCVRALYRRLPSDQYP